ncbi:hypothetical protein DFP72DRAFT_1060535 [Ephemerocybe angulata]|uniref:Uncharacterized protein n=1 Tax=Ephemerocybe angulata TaxID=980116 RepID=A0A8H6IFG0_9AGAR|nr:hypothetical protein DFP72DRAFT_1060535 [Tulosesus angulatus]
MPYTPILFARRRRRKKVGGWVPKSNNPSPAHVRRYVPPRPPSPFTVRDAPASHQVFRTPELLENILIRADWQSVMSISRSSFYGRTVAQLAVCCRILEVILPFVGNKMEKAKKFLDMMDRVGAGIIGSVARRLLAINSAWMDEAISAGITRFVSCRDLNLVVPPGRLELAVGWLGSLGYNTVRISPPSLPYSDSVTQIARMGRKIGGILLFATISEARNGIAHVVASSLITTQANIITSSRVYSFYPNSIATQLALRTEFPHLKAIRKLCSPYVLTYNNEHWKRCGNLCPVAQRNTVGDKGIASFVFDSSRVVPVTRFEGTDYLLAEHVILWRFSLKCRNRACENYDPGIERVLLI